MVLRAESCYALATAGPRALVRSIRGGLSTGKIDQIMGFYGLSPLLETCNFNNALSNFNTLVGGGLFLLEKVAAIVVENGDQE